MRPSVRRRPPSGRREPYGELPPRAEHRAVRTGHILHPQYGRKLLRMITRVFR